MSLDHLDLSNPSYRLSVVLAEVERLRKENNGLAAKVIECQLWKEGAGLALEEENERLVRAIFRAAPVQWAELALERQGFSDEEIEHMRTRLKEDEDK